jgi:hypothetical protein
MHHLKKCQVDILLKIDFTLFFMQMCNFAMWSVNTLEKSRADANPLQLEFFGMWPWIIIMNVSMPLTIFFRFHSTVVLCEIWKRCYKVKPDLM